MGRTKKEIEQKKAYDLDEFKFRRAENNSKIRHDETKKENEKKIKDNLEKPNEK